FSPLGLQLRNFAKSWIPTIKEALAPVPSTTARLTVSGAGDEDSGTITYTVTLNHAPKRDPQEFQIVLNNEQTLDLTLAVGQLTTSAVVAWGAGAPEGSILLDGYPDSDVYAEPEFALT